MGQSAAVPPHDSTPFFTIVNPIPMHGISKPHAFLLPLDGAPYNFAFMALNSGSITKFSLMQCFRLCLPALIIGAVLRIGFLYAIPEGFNGADTPSYTSTAAKVWVAGEHRLHFSDKRRWLYPMLMLPLPALPISPALSIPLFQHLLGLATIFGIGWIVGNLTVLKKIWVPFVTILFAMWPELIWFEHEALGDALLVMSFILMAALAMPLGSLSNRNRLFCFLMAAALVVSLKPHGRGIWLAAMLVAAWQTRNPHRWGWKCWMAVALGIFIIATSGSKRQGNWLMLNSALPLVSLDAPKWKEYREALRPAIEEARDDMGQYPWQERLFKKRLNDPNSPPSITATWTGLVGRKTEYSKVCGDLAKGAIREHPITFLKFTLTKIGIAFAHKEPIDNFEPASFWKNQTDEVLERWNGDPNSVKFFYGTDYLGFQQLFNKRHARTNPIAPLMNAVSNQIAWAHDVVDQTTGKHQLKMGWLGALALFGLLVALLPSRFSATSVLWFPAILCLLTVLSIGDCLGHYVIPAEWVALTLIAVGLDAVLVSGGKLVQKLFTKKGADSRSSIPA